MTTEKKGLEILQNHIQTVELHLDQIHFLLEELKNLLPFTAKIMNDMNRHQKADCDSLIFRFSHVQDTMGGKVLPLFLEENKEQTSSLTFIDKLNLLERLEILENADQWIDLRDLRNSVSHVYVKTAQEQADFLNKVCKAIPVFEECLGRIKQRIA